MIGAICACPSARAQASLHERGHSNRKARHSSPVLLMLPIGLGEFKQFEPSVSLQAPNIARAGTPVLL